LLLVVVPVAAVGLIILIFLVVVVLAGIVPMLLVRILGEELRLRVPCY